MQVENRSLTIQMTQMVTKFGNLENFKEIFEQNGFIVIQPEYLSLYYVAQIVSGQKKLLKQTDLTNFTLPLSFLNRIEGAEVKRVFGDLIENEPAIIAYFPDNCLKRTPPKVYFWKIYNLLKPELFRNLINSILDNAPRNGNIADIITIDPLIAQTFDESTTIVL